MLIKKASLQANRNLFDTWNHLLIVLARIALDAIRTLPLWISARFRLQWRHVVSGCQRSTCTSWICQNNRRMRDYFSPREGFWLRSRFGSTSSTFQFNLFHRRTWFGTGSSPSASPSFFFCCLSFFFSLSTLPSALCFDVTLCVIVFHPAAGSSTCEKILSETDLNMCLRSQSFPSQRRGRVFVETLSLEEQQSSWGTLFMTWHF